MIYSKANQCLYNSDKNKIYRDWFNYTVNYLWNVLKQLCSEKRKWYSTHGKQKCMGWRAVSLYIRIKQLVKGNLQSGLKAYNFFNFENLEYNKHQLTVCSLYLQLAMYFTAELTCWLNYVWSAITLQRPNLPRDFLIPSQSMC